MKKLNKKVLIFFVFILLWILYNSFVGIKKTDYYLYRKRNPEKLNHIDLFVAEKIIYTLFFTDDVKKNKLIYFEDKNKLYFIDKKFSFLPFTSLFAKTVGGCIRKKDGFLLIKGTQTWIPLGWIPYTRVELYDLLQKWRTVDETNRYIGPGVVRFHYYGITNNVCMSVFQQRVYLTNGENVELSFKNGIYFTITDLNEFDTNIELKEISGWCEGFFNLTQ